MENFDSLRGALDDALPAWWAHRDPSSEAYKTLQVLADLADDLAAQVESIYADQTLATAGDDALRSEYAALYGASHEQLPTSTELLRGYLQARAEDDGSAAALSAALVALTRNAENDTGVALAFPIDGSGLSFPADGSGLHLHEPVADTAALTWPDDGTGFTFPADGSGLIFPARGRVEVIDSPSVNRVDVNVREILSFDRVLFARAVARARMAHNFPSVITEVR